MQRHIQTKPKVNLIGLAQDYKSNIPLEMLENKYKIPIHKIIKVLYAVTVEEKENYEKV
jgi:hypothetical protein